MAFQLHLRPVPPGDPPLTRHARARAKERDISCEEIDLVRKIGRPTRGSGCSRLTLEGVVRPSHVPMWLWSIAASVVILEAAEGNIITVFRQLPRTGAFRRMRASTR